MLPTGEVSLPRDNVWSDLEEFSFNWVRLGVSDPYVGERGRVTQAQIKASQQFGTFDWFGALKFSWGAGNLGDRPKPTHKQKGPSWTVRQHGSARPKR